MPYIVPDVNRFITKFPEFEDYDGQRIQDAIDEAAGRIDRRWIESDYQPAILYLAAHLLATSGSGEAGDIQTGDSGGGVVTSESFGPISISYGSKGGGSGSTTRYEQDYAATEYGRRFMALLRVNFPPIVAI